MKRISALPVSLLPFVILISILVVGRSSSTPAVSQPDVFPVDREPYPGVSPNLSQMLQESRFAQRGGAAVKSTVALSGALANGARLGASPSTSSTGLSSLPRDAQRPISAALGKDNSRYWVHANADGFSAEIPQHALAINFTRLGVELESHNLRWRLETRGYGYGDAMLPLSAAAPNVNDNRVEYRHRGVTEWYENGPMGLEQGFILAEPPGKARKGTNQPLTLALAISGDLLAALEPAGLDKKSTALTLTRKNGQAALRYTGLSASDATGRELRSWLELRGKRLLLRVEDEGARYPVVVDPWIQQAELTDGGAYDHSGWSVAVSGNTIVVGAVCHPGTSIDCVAGYSGGPGAAYVFAESGGTWSQQQELTASDGAPGDWFGESVAVDGSTVVVGAPHHEVGPNASQGAAYVFAESGGMWSQQAELTASDGAAGDKFGWSVALNGNTAVLGAYLKTVGSNTQQGAAYVFGQGGGTWSQQAKLTASDGAASDWFGYSVAVNGGTAVVGSPGRVSFTRSSTYTGAAYVFVQGGTTWSQQAKLIASDGGRNDNFGNSVAVDENTSTAVVGALNHTVGRSGDQGAAYVFVQSGATWSQQAELTASDWAGDDNLGQSVALSGSTAVAGAPWHSVGSNKWQGTAYVYVPGAITVTLPASLNFANEALDNTSAAKAVTLTNSSTGTLNIASITVIGDFAISSTTCGLILTAGKACKVNVTFTPMELGVVTGTLTFSDNASNSPQTVALSGTGIVQATLNPASETYGNETVGTTSNPKTFTLANEQNVPLTGIAISTAGDFAVSATTCTTSLGAKHRCKIEVTFTPTQTGTLTGQLSVSDSASNSPQISNLTGTGK